MHLTSVLLCVASLLFCGSRSHAGEFSDIELPATQLTKVCHIRSDASNDDLPRSKELERLAQEHGLDFEISESADGDYRTVLGVHAEQGCGLLYARASDDRTHATLAVSIADGPTSATRAMMELVIAFGIEEMSILFIDLTKIEDPEIIDLVELEIRESASDHGLPGDEADLMCFPACYSRICLLDIVGLPMNSLTDRQRDVARAAEIVGVTVTDRRDAMVQLGMSVALNPGIYSVDGDELTEVLNRAAGSECGLTLLARPSGFAEAVLVVSAMSVQSRQIDGLVAILGELDVPRVTVHVRDLQGRAEVLGINAERLARESLEEAGISADRLEVKRCLPIC